MKTTVRVEQDGEDVGDCWALHASDRALLNNKNGVTRLGFAILLKTFHAKWPSRLLKKPSQDQILSVFAAGF